MSFMNRLANCHNQYQGRTKKVLCVCSAGLLRSPTTAKVLAEEYGYNTRAVGVNNEYALIPIDEVLIEWADEIVYMEEVHKRAVEYEDFKTTKPCKVLNIPDMFEWNAPGLISMIKTRYKEEELQE